MHHAAVSLGHHVMVDTGTVILLGTILEDDVAAGVISFVKKRCREFGIYFGVPAKRVSERKRNLLDLENQLIVSARQHQKH